MTSKLKTIPPLLIGLLAVSACNQATFCDTYTPVYFEAPVAAAVVAGDRAAAEDIATNNAIFEACPPIR